MGMRDTACTTVLFGRGLISGMLCDHDIVVFKALRHLLCVGLLCVGCEWSQRGSFWSKTVFEKNILVGKNFETWLKNNKK